MKKLIIALLLSFMTSGAYAGSHSPCGPTEGSINILANEFNTYRIFMDEVKSCAGSDVDFSVTHSVDHNKLQVAALSANPSEFSAKLVTNGSITPLMNEGLLRPLDDLVAKYGANLNDNQKITIDGKIYAVAFMANAQHLWYRESILNELGIAVPSTYEEVIAAAQKIKDSGKMANPYGGAFQSGWNLAQEFVNMYLGHGGEFFKSGSAQPNVNNENGVAALNVMKKLTEVSNPDFLTQDTNAVKEEWESGNLALMHVWNSGASSLLDDEGDQAVRADTRLAPSPSVGGGSMPATTLWWDGIAIATNTSDENADASFRALVGAASSSELANSNADATVWLIKDYKGGNTAGPVVDAASRGATPYPSFPHMSLMHGALSTELVEFLQGNESAEKALADVEAAYIAKATEQGFL
jgi:ABC-type glycerol-3-phosphate transport system substrate-binding protein|tara:strand:- start:209 stop:1444 length:1236 start_codon:yes stop_codon:yes gene_type:complete